MPLYDILNEFKKCSSHMAAVVKLKGKTKKPPLVVEEEKFDDSAVTSGHPNVTTSLLMAKDEKSDSVDVDIEKSTVPAVNPPTSGEALINGSHQSSDDIEDAEVIGVITFEDIFDELLQEEIVDETDEYVAVHKRIYVDAAAAASSVARALSIRRLTAQKGVISANCVHTRQYSLIHGRAKQARTRPQKVERGHFQLKKDARESCRASFWEQEITSRSLVTSEPQQF